MSIDGITTGLLLGAVEKSASSPEAQEDIYRLYKEMKEKGDRGPTEEAITFVEKNLLKSCKVLHTSYEGIIVGLNKATGGFYPGADSPVFVKITKNCDGNTRFDCAVGQTFEYALDQVKIFEG